MFEVLCCITVAIPKIASHRRHFPRQAKQYNFNPLEETMSNASKCREQLQSIPQITFLLIIYFQSIAKSDNVDEWISNAFQKCTIKIVGNPGDFNIKIPRYASRHPVTIDLYTFPQNHGPYNLTHLSLINGYSESSSNSKFPAKYTHCSVQLYFPVYYRNFQVVLNSLQNSLKGMVLLNDNPHFVIYMFTRLQALFPDLEFNLISLWNGISLTALPLIALRNSIRLVCLTCSRPFENPLGNFLTSGKFIHTKTKLNSEVKILTRNLSRKQVFFFGIQSQNIPFGSSCSMKKVGLTTPVELCAAFALLRKYNFTLGNPNRPYYPYDLIGELWMGQIMSTAAMKNTFLDVVKTHTRNAWIPYGCLYNPYVYVAFLSKEYAIDFLSLFQPFDFTTGCAFTVSTIALLFVTKIWIIKVIDENFSLFELIFFPIATLFEQGSKKVIASFQSTVGGYFLISTWLFLCYIIGNEYKGFLYSGMTSSPIQPVPESMIDMVMQSDMPYFTTTKHEFNGKYYSTLKDLVLADMIYSGEDNFMKRFLVRFRHRLSLVSARESNIIYNITKGLPVHSEHGMKILNKKFAIVSTKGDTEFFVGLMKKLTDFYIIPNKKVSPFVSRVPWYAKRNNFAKLVTLGIAQLVESGVYGRWIKNFRKQQLIGRLVEVDRKLNITGGNYFGMVVLAESQKQGIEGASIKLDGIYLVFIAVSMFLLISVFVFCTEKILNCECNAMKRRKTPVMIF
ncbi:unnamed protein product [Orchesella dallaii]|uniref:Uncharacterized protein n=1 Tax=Orchesella dallaii TaxID=48710 RepID=A0ABP1QN72_9HEXA